MNFLRPIFLTIGLVLSFQAFSNTSIVSGDITVPNRVDYPRITSKEMIVFQGDTITKVVSNGMPAIIARPDQDVNKLLAAVNLSKTKFAAYNDFSPILLDELITGAVYYLERKNRSAEIPFHIVGPRETIWDVSQIYGIRKDILLKKNRMSPTEDIIPGRKLYLQKKRGKKDKVEIIDLSENTPDEGPWEKFIDKKSNKSVKTIGDRNNTLGDLMPSVNPEARFHTVREGETIFSVAKVYNVTPLEIKKWNNLDNINLKKGDIIQVKPTSNIANNNNPSNINTLSPNNKNNSEAILLPSLNGGGGNSALNNNNNTGNSFNQVAGNTNYGSQNNTALNNNNSTNFGQQGNAAVPANKTHLVERGEGVYSIARKYNLPPKELMKWNGLNNNSLLDVGEQIYLAPGMAPPAKHVVKKGETLYRISKKYDTEVNDIIAWNQLSGTDIQEGQTIFVSQPTFNTQSNVSTTGWQQTSTNNNNQAMVGAVQGNQVYTSTANNSIGNFNQVAGSNQNNINTNANTANNINPNVAATQMAGSHVVKSNENIYEIAARYKVSVADLRSWNNLAVGSNIKTGDKLIVDQSLVTTGNVNTNNANTFNQTATENTNTTNNSILAPAIQNTNNTNNNAGTGNSFLQPASDNSSNLTQPAGEAVYHTVKPNENLFSISKMYGVQVSQIKRLSQKSNNQVSVGERLRVR
jgi:LysM repeat protein